MRKRKWKGGKIVKAFVVISITIIYSVWLCKLSFSFSSPRPSPTRPSLIIQTFCVHTQNTVHWRGWDFHQVMLFSFTAGYFLYFNGKLSPYTYNWERYLSEMFNLMEVPAVNWKKEAESHSLVPDIIFYWYSRKGPAYGDYIIWVEINLASRNKRRLNWRRGP